MATNDKAVDVFCIIDESDKSCKRRVLEETFSSNR